MDAPIAEIERVLREQLTPLDAEAGRLKGQLASVEEQSARLRAALEALGGGPPKAKPPKRGRPCAKKAEVLEIVTKLVRENGVVPVDDLEGLAKETVSSELGRSLSGFGLRFRESLADPRFAVDGGHCRLAANRAS